MIGGEDTALVASLRRVSQIACDSTVMTTSVE